MDFLKLLEEYENYRRSFGVDTSPSGHSACVGFAAWLNQNASQPTLAPDVAGVCRKVNHFYVEGVCANCGCVQPRHAGKA